MVFLLAATAYAANTIAVLEIVPMGDVKLEISASRYMTDELRNNARNVLPRAGYVILTRENVLQLLPPDEEERICLAEACAVDIGRAIGAEYITQGYIGQLGDLLTLSVELYETMSGNLLGSFLAESKEITGLLAAIREKSPGMFANVKTDVDMRVELIKSKEKLKSEPKQTSNAWLAVSLDILGVVALGIGAYKHINAKNLYNDYKAMEPGHDDDYYEPKRKEAKDAQKIGNIGYIVGGALLMSGIAIHIRF